jgi:glycine betaine/proline transport system permease protein
MVLKNDRGMFNWFGVIFVTLILIALQDKWSWLSEYPEDFILPITAWLNVMMDWLVENLGWFFLGVSWFLEWPIKSVQWVLHVLPWAATTFLFCVLAYVASGWRLVFFTLASCLYMVVIGYWPESMNTLSLVAISVPLAILIGFGIGVWGFYSSRAERSIMPMLDMLQTIPVFAYLLPILM